MTTRVPAFVLVLASAIACSGPAVELVRTTSMRNFHPSERRAVWGRAITSFQMVGGVISLSDPIGGVLRTEVQPSSTVCSTSVQLVDASETKMCRETRFSQFTMTDDGVAFLRTNRRVVGETHYGRRLLTDEERSALQNECDETLSFVVGESNKEPTPAPAPPDPLTQL